MSSTPYGQAWEAFRREHMRYESGYYYELAQKAFGAGYSAGLKYKPTEAELAARARMETRTDDGCRHEEWFYTSEHARQCVHCLKQEQI